MFLFVLGWCYLQVAFSTQRSITAMGYIRFVVEHETDGTFPIGFGKARVGALEPSGELTVGDETSDMFGIPFAGWIEAGTLFEQCGEVEERMMVKRQNLIQ